VWGVGAQVLAALRDFLVSVLHHSRVRKKKAALVASRREHRATFSFYPLSVLRFLGLYAA
jgi:hypothetical protein